MPMFLKKPVIVEAKKFTIEDAENVANWAGTTLSRRPDGTPNAMIIYTLEGVSVAKINDWIIKVKEDLFYPCEESIFVRNYEEVK